MKKLLITITGAVFSALCLRLEPAKANHPLPLTSQTSTTTPSYTEEHSHNQEKRNVFVASDANSPSYYASGNLYSLLATGGQTDGQFSLLNFLVSPVSPGAVRPPLHLHTREAESFFVKDGELRIFMEDEPNLSSAPEVKDWSAIKTMTVGPGSFVYLPKGRIHEFMNPGTTPVNTLSLLTPTGFENALTFGPPVTDKSAPIPPFTEEGRQIYEANAYQFGLTCENCVNREEILAQLKGQQLQDYLIVPGDAPGREPFSLGGNQYTSLATDEETGGLFSLYNVSLGVQTEPGAWQKNEKQTESYYVLDGDVNFLFEDQSLVATPGTLVSFRQNTPYSFQNLGTAQARTLFFRTGLTTAIPEPSAWLGLLGCGAYLSASLALKGKRQKLANL